jgi:hypothetical protein
MRSNRRGNGTVQAAVGIPIGDLERIRDLNRKCAGWVDEWDFIREAVRRRLDELGQKFPSRGA